MAGDSPPDTFVPLMVRRMCDSILGSGSYPTVQARVDTLIGFLRNTNRKTPFDWEETWADLLGLGGPESPRSISARPDSGGCSDARFLLPDLESMRRIMDFPMIPDRMDRDGFLALMTEWEDEFTRHPGEAARKLTECGMNAAVTGDGTRLELEGLVLESDGSENGEPCITCLRVVESVYEMVTGDFPRSDESDPRDRFRDLRMRLENFWEKFPDHPVSKSPGGMDPPITR